MLEVLHAAFEEYRGKLDPPSGVHSETSATIREKLTKGWAVIAKVNGKIVGCVFGQLDGDAVYLGRLAVLPEFRRLGIAHKLVAWIEQEGHALNARCIRLGVRLPLHELQAWYERQGYRVVESRTHAGYRHPTSVIMEKPLHPARRAT